MKITLHILLVNLIFCLTIENVHAYLLNDKTLPILYKPIESQQNRIVVAKKLLNNLEQLRFLLPKPSPNDLAILQQQRKYLDNFKLKNSLNNQKSLHEWISNLSSYQDNPYHYLYDIDLQINQGVTSLNCIINAKNVKNEMYCWVITSAIFLDLNSWQLSINGLIRNHLVNNVDLISNNKDDPTFKLGMLYKIYHGFGMEILLNILMPYMSERMSISGD